jgi:hypothetical protein
MAYYTDLELETPIICYNGALAFDPTTRKPIHYRGLSAPLARHAIRIARQLWPEVRVSAENLNRWYAEKWDPRKVSDHLREHHNLDGRKVQPDIVGPVATWLKKSVTKLLLVGMKEWIDDVQQALDEKLHDHVRLLRTGNLVLEVTHHNVSKADALAAVADYLQVSREGVMAIGDNINDIEMIQWAGIGVAMGQAPKPVRKASDYITEQADQAGVAKALLDIVIQGHIPKAR